MQRVTYIVCALAVVLVGTTSQAAILNGSFESGLDSWEKSGVVQVVGSVYGGPTDGASQVQLFSGPNATNRVNILPFLDGLTVTDLNALAAQNAGAGATYRNSSVIKQTFYASAGATLSFDWKFLTNEPETNMDIAFWILSPENAGNVLAGTQLSSLSEIDPSGGFSHETDYQTTTYTFTQSGTYTLYFGVANVNIMGSDTVPSALLIDNVFVTPEPASVAIFGIGALVMGAGAYRRRKQAAKE